MSNDAGQNKPELEKIIFFYINTEKISLFKLYYNITANTLYFRYTDLFTPS